MMKGRYNTLIGSFLVATAFWFSVTMNGTFRTHLYVPLTVSNMPRDIALVTPLPESVDVLLQADGWQLLFMNAGKQMAFEIPGSRLRGGVIQTNRALNEMMRLPPGVTAMRVYPETLFVQVDRFMKKTVPLHLASLSMHFKEGFGMLGDAQLSPDSITLQGAERVLRGIRSWPVEGRSYTELSMPVAEDLKVKDSLPGVIRYNLDKVSLYIPTEQLADMWFRDVRVHLRHVPADREVLLGQQTIDVSVRGGVNVLSLYGAQDVSAEIEFEDIVLDTSGTIIPTLKLPGELKLLKMEPPEIRYTMRK
ncbi:MAG: hypothetical protein IH600_10695 [Bacteroidetes bacterium]|nr:hypothetical protein [Bacteroidota bacterium]